MVYDSASSAAGNNYCGGSGMGAISDGAIPDGFVLADGYSVLYCGRSFCYGTAGAGAQKDQPVDVAGGICDGHQLYAAVYGAL